MSRVPISLHYIGLVVFPVAIAAAVVNLWDWPLWAGVAIALATLIGGALLVIGFVVLVGMLIATQVHSVIDEELHPSGIWNHANVEGVPDYEWGDRS